MLSEIQLVHLVQIGYPWARDSFNIILVMYGKVPDVAKGLYPYHLPLTLRSHARPPCWHARQVPCTGQRLTRGFLITN
jgi:hypothetical protein